MKLFLVCPGGQEFVTENENGKWPTEAKPVGTNLFFFFSLSINKYSSNTQLCPETLTSQVSLDYLPVPLIPFLNQTGLRATEVQAHAQEKQPKKKRKDQKIQVDQGKQCELAVRSIREMCRIQLQCNPVNCRIEDAESVGLPLATICFALALDSLIGRLVLCALPGEVHGVFRLRVLGLLAVA